METIEIPVGEYRFTARAAGPDDGRLVLLLHGFPQTAACWRPQLEALADAGYRAVAPDQRGYSSGARPDDVEAYALPHLVADVLGMADEIGGHQFDLVGHDWGGAVAWHVAGRYPDRVRSLTVVSTPHPGAFGSALREESGDQSHRSSYIQFFREQPEVAEESFLTNEGGGLRSLFSASGHKGEVEPYVEALRQQGAMAAAINWYRAASVTDAEGLGPITAPTLYVWSTDDIALGRAAAEATAQHVEGPYRFEVLDGVSHWIPEEAPDRLNGLLLEHLAAAA